MSNTDPALHPRTCSSTPRLPREIESVVVSGLTTFLIHLLKSPAAWIMAWLCVLDVVLRLLTPFLYSTSYEAIGWYWATEKHLFKGASSAPTIVLAGSSRMRDNISPYVLEATLGLQRGSVINLGLSSGRPSDAFQLYRDHRDSLSSSRLLVLGLEDWQFNALWSESTDKRFRMRTSIRDILAHPVAQGKADLILGHLWALWDMRTYLRTVIGDALAHRDAQLPALEHDALGRITWPRHQSEPPRGPESDAVEAERYLRTYVVWDHELDALRRLRQALAADGVRLVLVRLPLRASYNRSVDTSYHSQDETWKQAVESALPGTALHDMRAADEWGLSDAVHFWDYGHMNSIGSEVFSRRFAEWLLPRNFHSKHRVNE